MPKVVDHEQRRAELAAATWRVAARDGAHAISIRTVAAEAGWSTGALRYYFRTRDELLAFTMRRHAERIVRRITATAADAETGPDISPLDWSARLAEELLPLDAERRDEFAVWSAVGEEAGGYAGGTPSAVFAAQRAFCRQLVARLSERPRLPDPFMPQDPRSEAVSEYLHVFMDGLGAQLVFTAHDMPPARARRVLRDFLGTIPLLVSAPAGP